MSDELRFEVLTAIEQEQYEKAFKIVEPLARNGSAAAQGFLGLFFQLGFGCKQDRDQAIYWLTLAAQSGDGCAAHNLGTVYGSEWPGVAADYQKSHVWYLRAKTLGFQVAPDDWYDASKGILGNQTESGDQSQE